MSTLTVVLIAAIAWNVGFLMGMLWLAWSVHRKQYPDHQRVRTSRWAHE